MDTGRLEAFSDGVLAIALTIMVLELKVPHGEDWVALKPLWPVFLGYVLSFVYIGIYWNNHHHMLQAAERVDGRVLWANLHLLFWLSLIPVTTGWLGASYFVAPAPAVLYGVMLLGAAAAYLILERQLIRANGPDSALARAVGKDRTGWISMGLYLLGTVTSFFLPLVGVLFYVAVAVIWFVPDRRIERRLKENGEVSS